MFIKYLEIIIHDFKQPVQYLIPAFLMSAVLMGIVWLIRNRQEKGLSAGRLIAWICLFSYVLEVLQITLFSREPGSRKQISLILFETWGYTPQMHAYFIENILMFVPYGVLVPILFRRMRKPLYCVWIGCLCSCMIEGIQLLTQRGFLQIDDVVTNTTGALIGWLIWHSLRRDGKMTDTRDKADMTLLIMAAGIGSRFGGGIKQLEPVDARNHMIMDYSIHDAIEAGFRRVIFIIRKDMENEFKRVIGDRIKQVCREHGVTVEYAFQDITDIPGDLPEGRTKPWGTGQAVLAAREKLKTPFIVINADDYYGKEGFRAIYKYLLQNKQACMAGFVLKNTLSDNGGVTRGICQMNEQNDLTEIIETRGIVKVADEAEANGIRLNADSLVSMNMWGLTPDVLDMLQTGFEEFFEREVPENPLGAEYLIPVFIEQMITEKRLSVKVLCTKDSWYGMTYREDVAVVRENFQRMLQEGKYRQDLFSDL